MSNTPKSVIGSGETSHRFLLVYVFGVILGTGIRLVSKLVPNRIVDRFINK